MIRPTHMTHRPDNRTLLIFGPPYDTLDQLRDLFQSLGPMRSYRPGPDGCHWYILEYEDPVSAAYALRKHGEIVSGRWILGVRVGDVGVPSGPIPPDGRGRYPGGQDPNTIRMDVARWSQDRQIGTPIRMSKGTVMKGSGTGPNGAREEEAYAWDEDEGKSHWILEKLVRVFTQDSPPPPSRRLRTSKRQAPYSLVSRRDPRCSHISSSPEPR
jgi:hypothetical protein